MVSIKMLFTISLQTQVSLRYHGYVDMFMQFTAELTAVKCQFSDEKCCNIFLIFVLNFDCG